MKLRNKIKSDLLITILCVLFNTTMQVTVIVLVFSHSVSAHHSGWDHHVSIPALMAQSNQTTLVYVMTVTPA